MRMLGKVIHLRRCNTMHLFPFYTLALTVLISTAIVIWSFRDECYHFPIPPTDEHFRKCGRNSKVQSSVVFEYETKLMDNDNIKRSLDMQGKYRSLRMDKSKRMQLKNNPQKYLDPSLDINTENGSRSSVKLTLISEGPFQGSASQKDLIIVRRNITEYFNPRKKFSDDACVKLFYTEDSISLPDNNSEEMHVELQKLEKLERGMNRFFAQSDPDKRNKWVYYKHKDFHNKLEIQWCPLYKSASTPWMAVFTKLSKALTVITEIKIRTGKITFPKLARDFRLLIPKIDRRTVAKLEPKYLMVVVRHPFKRLLSAYRDKIERIQGRQYFYKKYSVKILNKFRPKHVYPSANEQSGVPVWRKMALDVQRSYDRNGSSSNDDDIRESQSGRVTLSDKVPSDNRPFKKLHIRSSPRARKEPPTFEEFCRYLLTVDPRQMDEHWRPQYLDCSPCHNKFDLILKVETLQQDKEAVFELLGFRNKSLTEYLELDKTWKSWTNPSGRDYNESYYFSQLSASLIQDLHRIYEYDFLLFGYSAEPYFGMTS